MADPKAQAAKQLENILKTTGKSLKALSDEVQAAGLEKHGQILKYFKSEHGLGHGNANLLAHSIRERLAGGPPAEDALLEAQYSGKKAAMRPLYEAVAAQAAGMGGDVTQIVQKTGVSFRRKKQFALLQATTKSLRVGLNLPETPDDARVIATTGMCKQRVELRDDGEIDADFLGWLRASYDAAG